jgi:hypothetical protein
MVNLAAILHFQVSTITGKCLGMLNKQANVLSRCPGYNIAATGAGSTHQTPHPPRTRLAPILTLAE